MICACSSPETRAQAVLESLRGCSGAAAGFLFFARNQQLVLAASTDHRAPPAGLADEAMRIWKEQPETPSSDSTIIESPHKMKYAVASEHTASWMSATGVTFGHRLLSVHRNSRWLPIGIAMLEVSASAALLPVYRTHVDALCNALVDSGDVGALGVEQPA
jgi:hypothetical protein